MRYVKWHVVHIAKALVVLIVALALVAEVVAPDVLRVVLDRVAPVECSK